MPRLTVATRALTLLITGAGFAVTPAPDGPADCPAYLAFLTRGSAYPILPKIRDPFGSSRTSPGGEYMLVRSPLRTPDSRGPSAGIGDPTARGPTSIPPGDNAPALRG